MHFLYGLLCGVVGAIVGVPIGIGVGLLIVRVTKMSSFEGKSGFFVAFMGLAVGAIGFLATTIVASLWFSFYARRS